MLNNSSASDLRGVLKPLDIEVEQNLECAVEYFWKSITVPFLGLTLNEMKTRFTNLHTRTALGANLIEIRIPKKFSMKNRQKISSET